MYVHFAGYYQRGYIPFDGTLSHYTSRRVSLLPHVCRGIFSRPGSMRFLGENCQRQSNDSNSIVGFHLCRFVVSESCFHRTVDDGVEFGLCQVLRCIGAAGIQDVPVKKKNEDGSCLWKACCIPESISRLSATVIAFAGRKCRGLRWLRPTL